MCKIFYITFFRLLQFWLWDLLIALLFWSDHACETEFYCMFTHISKALYNFLWILWVQESQIQDSGMFLLYQSILLPCYHELVCICIRWFCFGSILLCGHVCRLASFSNHLVHCNLKCFSGLWKSSTQADVVIVYMDESGACCNEGIHKHIHVNSLAVVFCLT